MYRESPIGHSLYTDLESTLHSFILTHVQRLDQLFDLVFSTPIFSLPSSKLLPLLCEVGVLIQGLLVYMTAGSTPLAEHVTDASVPKSAMRS